MFLVYNSDILVEADYRVSSNDRAFQYGDGLFETIRYERGQIWFWTDHYARLKAGSKALHLRLPASSSESAVAQLITNLVATNKLTDQTCRIKIQIWRQSGGLYTPSSNEANLLITAQTGHPFAISERATVGIYTEGRLTYTPYSSIKTLSSLPYVMAGIAKKERNLDDIILLNADKEDYLAECQASNLFWFMEGVLYTPAIETGCINGIMRQYILRTAEAIGLPVDVGFHRYTCLAKAEAVFACNVNGIQWIRSIEQLGTYPAGHKLANALFTALL
ncbi:aminotransferase class IV [Spirosoma utsteinense]|uniref:branched-chain-amino-acid transaminase n=1 Tax=Spirosoma utsteinense TaxID=2585773 RepID=A0ABR6W238_9BACT|nr:aminotransferase class IV [Spirosoma utsteinense]MBC3786594.1 branched-chain amino acid aminotransferase/4-amino-4-deoxychorismate lyase [Spirosoma utsteinense]MBC3789972.1 branched-chain amino acid aminotransferase/4-amino-4-deoxychorismate lyase [Spirosoma utsteinense]